MVVSNDPLMHDSLFSPPVMTRSCEVSPMMGAKFGSVIIQSYDTEQSASLVDAQRVDGVVDVRVVDRVSPHKRAAGLA